MTICGGRPTCHRAYDEATAILVGDALQALGFAVLASEPMDGVSAAVRLEMLRVLAHAIGTGAWPAARRSIWPPWDRRCRSPRSKNMHRRKTGALIQCSVLLGALAAGVSGGGELRSPAALRRGGDGCFRYQGLFSTFAGDPGAARKSTGATSALAKPTIPACGLAASRLRAGELRDPLQLEPLGNAARPRATGQLCRQSRQLSGAGTLRPSKGCRDGAAAFGAGAAARVH